MDQQQKAQTKRGRKPRGGFNNLQDIIKSQQPETNLQTNNLNVAGKNFKLFPDDLPWQITGGNSNVSSNNNNNGGNNNNNNNSNNNNNYGNAKSNECSDTKNHIIDDEELDNYDLFPNDETIEYEKLYKINTSQNRTLHMNIQDINDIYRPQQQNTTTNASLDIGLIPEHLRIIDIEKFISSQNSTTTPTPTPTPIPTTPKKNEPELYHPLRVNFYDDQEYKSVENYKIDDDISWPSRSPFACWWCCHTFDEYPKPVPVEIQGNNIRVMGNCCSWNCNKAYCIKNHKTLSLFNTFYTRLFPKESSDLVKPAPSPLCTKMFGGSLTIEEYRSSFHNSKRRVSLEVLSNINITVAKTFIYDSKVIQSKQLTTNAKKRKI